MKINKRYLPYLKRLLWLTAVTTVAVVVFNELAFKIYGEDRDRAPTVIELVIPDGTAEKVARGESEPSIPDELNFILGDVLVVINEDSQTHELGPVLVPAGSRGALSLDNSDEFTYSCSFRPNRFLGLSVQPPTDFITRLEGIFFSVPATVSVLFLYSLLVRPIKPEDTPASVE
jgi:hypothetical protein